MPHYKNIPELFAELFPDEFLKKTVRKKDKRYIAALETLRKDHCQLVCTILGEECKLGCNNIEMWDDMCTAALNNNHQKLYEKLVADGFAKGFVNTEFDGVYDFQMTYLRIIKKLGLLPEYLRLYHDKLILSLPDKTIRRFKFHKYLTRDQFFNMCWYNGYYTNFEMLSQFPIRDVQFSSWRQVKRFYRKFHGKLENELNIPDVLELLMTKNVTTNQIRNYIGIYNCTELITNQNVTTELLEIVASKWPKSLQKLFSRLQMTFDFAGRQLSNEVAPLISFPEYAKNLRFRSQFRSINRKIILNYDSELPLSEYWKIKLDFISKNFSSYIQRVYTHLIPQIPFDLVRIMLENHF